MHLGNSLVVQWASLVAQHVKHLPAMRETQFDPCCGPQPEASLSKLSQSDYLPQISTIDKVPQGGEMVKPALPGSGALKRLLAPTVYSNGAAHTPGSCAFSSIL